MYTMLLSLLLLACSPSSTVLGNPVTTAWYQAEVECVNSQAVFEMPDPPPVVVYMQQRVAIEGEDRIEYYAIEETDVGSNGTTYTSGCNDDVTFTYMMVVVDE